MEHEMTSRERVKAAVDFANPDRIPIRHASLPSAFIKYPELFDLLKGYPSDFAGETNVYANVQMYTKGSWIDEWGCLWTVLEDGILGQVTGHPLGNLDSLQNYQWPDANKTDISNESSLVNNRGEKYAIIGWLTLFERLIDLRGFENAMIDIVMEDHSFYEIRDKIVEYNLTMIDRYLELDPDCIALADDWGSQISLMINPDLWRKLFLPAYKTMFERIRNAGKHVFFHSDGKNTEILPDLVDAGVNILWVDLTINPLKELAEKMGGKVCFQGLTDVQFLMKEGTPADVENHAKSLIRSLGDFNGGFIACSELAPDQPLDNMRAVYKAFEHYGKYPFV